MDPYSFPPFAAVLNGADAAVTWIAGNIDGILPEGVAVLVAIAIATLVVRALLIPVGLSNARAQVTRARLAPKLRLLQRRHGKDRALLAGKTRELYSTEHVSPFAGMLPALAQIPVVSVVYGVFTRATVAGHANALLAHAVFGSPLGASFAQLLAAGAFAQLALPFALLVLIAGIAIASRRLAVQAARAADAGAPEPTGLARALTWLPLLSVVFAGVAPMAASVYLAVSMAWTSVERTLAQRHYLAAGA
ncbi:MAG TPA: membrane protein insertase YidC [Humibacter sp.]|nr:membrane protein insertase YidC [Humibacter sp.]